jgi:N-hydroxyarylamine O-acetyltransferase
LPARINAGSSSIFREQLAMSDLDLRAYLARIRYDGPLAPDYATLAALLAAHMNAIHFENIDVLLGRPIRLDLESLQDKIVRRRRGGYCFEQATLFDAVLRAIGFKTTLRTARVTLVLAPDKAPRGHMLVAIDLPEGSFIADPGLGGLGCRAPIPLDGTPVEERGETNRIVFDGRRHMLKIESGERKLDAWVSGLDPDNWVDFEVANHWFATHPDSPMRQRLMLRAMTPDGRLTVMNRDVTIRANGQVSSRRLEDRAALRALLQDALGFDLPEAEALRAPTIAEWT